MPQQNAPAISAFRIIDVPSSGYSEWTHAMMVRVLGRGCLISPGGSND
jgi:hypothetical protein